MRMDNLEVVELVLLLPVTCIIGCLVEVTYFDAGVPIEYILLLVDEVYEQLLVLVDEEALVGGFSLKYRYA